MKHYLKTAVLTTLYFLLFQIAIFAQDHPGKITSAKEGLPKNRAAFIFCYNKAASYSNPAEKILKANTAKQTASNTTYFKSQNTQEQVRMFPNMTHDELWVQIKNEALLENPHSVEIYNANGDIIYYAAIESAIHKINVCDFSTGTFLVKLGDNVQKLIIE